MIRNPVKPPNILDLCTRIIAMVVLPLLFLGGCGGSGGGGSDGPPPDTSFNPGSGFDNGVHVIAAAKSGGDDIYVGGLFTKYQGVTANYIIRLNSNGTIDSGFDVGAGFNGAVYDIALAPGSSGDIYVAGDFTAFNGVSVNRIVRLNSDGSLDAGFDVGTGFDDRVNRVVPADDGSGDVYAGGFFTEYRGVARNRLARVNSNGSLDLGFDVGTGFDGDVDALAMAVDGSRDIYVGGAFNTYRGNTRNRLVRINSDGSIDAGFDIGAGFNHDVNDIAWADDGSGDIYVGGIFTVYDGFTMDRIARLNDDGTLDTAFNIGLGFNLFVDTIAVTSGGDVYVGGGFFNYDGNTTVRTARLGSDGSFDPGFDTGSGYEKTVKTLEITAQGLYVGGYFDTYNTLVVGGIVRVGNNGRHN